MSEECKSQDNQEEDRTTLSLFKELTYNGVIVKLEDTKNEVRKDSFWYALFGGGKTARVVSRKQPVKREKDVVLYSMPFIMHHYELVKGRPPSPYRRTNESNIFSGSSLIEQQILSEIDKLYFSFIKQDEVCCWLYSTEHICFEKSISIDTIEPFLLSCVDDITSWVGKDNVYSQRLSTIITIHILNYITRARDRECVLQRITKGEFQGVVISALQDYAEECIGAILILYYKFAFQLKVRYDAFGHDSVCIKTFDSFRRLKNCIDSMWSMFISSKLEKTTSVCSFCTKNDHSFDMEDAQIFLEIYQLMNDGTSCIEALKEIIDDCSLEAIASIRYFAVSFLDRTLNIMGIHHTKPFFDLRETTTLFDTSSNDDCTTALMKDAFRQIALLSVCTTLLPAFLAMAENPIQPR